MSSVRYPVQIAAEARRLRAAGWTIPQIRRLLFDREGLNVSRNTIWQWVDDDAADRQRRRQKVRNSRVRAQRAKYTWPGRPRTEDWLHGRMCHLRSHGLSCAAIATVMRLDHGFAVTEAQVRRSLRGHRGTA